MQARGEAEKLEASFALRSADMQHAGEEVQVARSRTEEVMGALADREGALADSKASLAKTEARLADTSQVHAARRAAFRVTSTRTSTCCGCATHPSNLERERDLSRQVVAPPK